METHSNILAWKITWTEEPGGLQSMGLQKGSDTADHMHTPPLPPRPTERETQGLILLKVHTS